MPLICPVCSRSNPDEALYCYHDGANLPGAAPREGPVAVGSQPFRSPFFLPSGGICRNFDELVLACEERWEEARDLLREELLAGFFSGLGRTDLAFAARRAAAEPDVDVGLDRLLAELPGGVRLPARLGVRPAEINLGRVGRGEDHQLVVRIQNEGMGLLRGSASCGHVNWLVFGDEAGAPHKVFQCRHDLALTMRVIGKRLRAGSHPQEALLQIETNGGTAVVVVRVEAPAVAPFPDGVLAGAESPRQLAEKTRAAPREAAPLFENGAVAAWYEANGWTYPVRGPKATGVAGVQQFFEALGLAAPPRVELDRQHVYLEGPPGAALETALVVQTSEHRPVFAHAVAADPWITVGRAVLSGRTARIPVRVPLVPVRPGEQLVSQVRVTANGHQRFNVPVTLTVTAEAAPPIKRRPAPPPRRERAAPTPPSPDSGGGRRGGRPGLLAWAFAAAFFVLATAAVAVVLVVVWLTPNGDTAVPTPVAQMPTPQSPLSSPNEKEKPPDDPPQPAAPKPPDVTELAKLLESDDPQDRIDAARRLGAMGPAAAPALHDLLRAMEHHNADFRREALLVLPKIGAPTRTDADVLGDLANETTFPEGRLYALDALVALGADARPALLSLCAALRDRNPAARRKAAEAIGNIGPGARDMARRDLIDALRDADPDVAAAATAALAKTGPPSVAEAPTLQVLLQDKAEPARRFALNGFRDLGPNAADFVPYLEDSVAGDASPALRRLAISALCRMAPAAPRTADAFTRALADGDAEVRRAAAAALAKMGVDHGALHGLLVALGSDDEATGRAAEDALKAAKLSDSQVEAMGDALRTKNAALRLRVLGLLKPLGADAAPAVPGMCAVLKDGPGEPRQQVFAVLTAMGPAARKAGGALDDLLDDDKFVVRMDAAVALAAIEGADAAEAVPALMEALRVEKLDDAAEAAERDRAVEALGRIGTAAVKPLASALEGDFAAGSPQTVKGQINAQARLAAVKALGLIGHAAYSSRVNALLSTLQRTDLEPAVREAAREARAQIRKERADR